MLTLILIWLNKLANGAAALLLSPIAWLPGWLSVTLASIVTGVLMLLAFKYTSNQKAIKQTRNQIRANLLALSLFKDDVFVGLRCQGRLIYNAGRLLIFSLVPMLVLFLPMCLLLSQLGLWYQVRPLNIDEEAVVTVRLDHNAASAMENLRLASSPAMIVLAGPVRVREELMVCWNIQARRAGNSALSFELQGKTYEKELNVGTGFARTSLKRPPRHEIDVLLHPKEPPFPPDSPVQSIEIDYPSRQSWTAGSHSWLIYWFATSMVAALATRPLLRVNI
jgi:hypothetical protein